MAKAPWTAGPYSWRLYGNEPEDLERMRQLGIKPVRMLSNEGQISLIAGDGDNRKRIAQIDCQTKYKRGEGYKTECAERDANARLFSAADKMAELTKQVAAHFASTDSPLGEVARQILVQIESPAP